MRQSLVHLSFSLCLSAGVAHVASAAAPQPDQRQTEFAHVCAGGPDKGTACSPAAADDCPGSRCVLATLSKPIRGTLTIIAHDSVTDWLNGVAGNRALTVMLELKAPDGSKQMLAATYQDLAVPSEPPAGPGNVVAIPMDENALQNLASGVSGLLFVRPESTLSQELQALFASTGTPVLVATTDGSARGADHTGDGLATVLRFKVKIQFLEVI
jgi:hypothetical protein